MTLACLHQDVVLITGAHTVSFPVWYHWKPSVQFPVLWKTSSLSISQCALKVIVCFWNHILDISAPHLYNRNYTSSQRSHEEEFRLANVPQWCADVAIVTCQRKVKVGREQSHCICVHKGINKYIQEKKELSCCSFLRPSHQLKWGSNPLGKNSGYFFWMSLVPQLLFSPQSWTHLPSNYRIYSQE